MLLRPPQYTVPDTLFPYTPLCRSVQGLLRPRGFAGLIAGHEQRGGHADDENGEPHAEPAGHVHRLSCRTTGRIEADTIAMPASMPMQCVRPSSPRAARCRAPRHTRTSSTDRSEEHTSELPSLIRRHNGDFCLQNKKKK